MKTTNPRLLVLRDRDGDAWTQTDIDTFVHERDADLSWPRERIERAFGPLNEVGVYANVCLQGRHDPTDAYDRAFENQIATLSKALHNHRGVSAVVTTTSTGLRTAHETTVFKDADGVALPDLAPDVELSAHPDWIDAFATVGASIGTRAVVTYWPSGACSYTVEVPRP